MGPEDNWTEKTRMNDLRSIEQQLLAQVDCERLMDMNANVAKEVRLSGSPEELRAFKYVQSQLEDFGFETQLLFSEAYISLPGEASLSVAGVDYPCITHSMSISVSRIEAPLVYVKKGTPDDLPSDTKGKILLIDGLAVPSVVQEASARGAVGLVFVNANYTHEMIISPVWGHPTPETVKLLPDIPAVSVTKQAGEDIKAQLQQGRVLCALGTTVDTKFRQIPTLIAEIKGQETPDDFVMFSGHVDSWHYGAMDNGSANALMLEVARILSLHQRELKRSLRLAFWSGHSHGRYAGSSWYCDTHWEELHEHCILHVNVDSVGGKGSTILTQANCMAETKGVAVDVISSLIGETFVGTRYSRSGDQSFWGPGIPSLFMGLSEQPPVDNPAADAFGTLFGGGKTGGFGWWWHTTEDTLDKIEPDCLVRDTRVYVLTIFRFLSEGILPINQVAAAGEIRDALVAWQEKAKEHFDLSLAIGRASDLVGVLGQLRSEIAKVTKHAEEDAKTSADVTSALVGQVNTGIMGLSRLLVPLNYVKGNMFNHDLGLGQPPIPRLADISTLVGQESGSMAYRGIKTALQRKYNEVTYDLKQAVQLAEQLLQAVRSK